MATEANIARLTDKATRLHVLRAACRRRYSELAKWHKGMLLSKINEYYRVHSLSIKDSKADLIGAILDTEFDLGSEHARYEAAAKMAAETPTDYRLLMDKIA